MAWSCCCCVLAPRTNRRTRQLPWHRGPRTSLTQGTGCPRTSLTDATARVANALVSDGHSERANQVRAEVAGGFQRSRGGPGERRVSLPYVWDQPTDRLRVDRSLPRVRETRLACRALSSAAELTDQGQRGGRGDGGLRAQAAADLGSAQAAPCARRAISRDRLAQCELHDHDPGTTRPDDETAEAQADSGCREAAIRRVRSAQCRMVHRLQGQVPDAGWHLVS